MKINHIRAIVSTLGLVILGVAIVVMLRQTFNKQVPTVVTPSQTQKAAPFSIESSVFNNDSTLPAEYTCKGKGNYPPLTFKNAPDNTEELVLVLSKLDESSKDAVYWTVWNIPGSTNIIQKNKPLPEGSIQGKTSFDTQGYHAPCPKDGKNESFRFDLYALDERVDLGQGSDFSTLLAAINGKVIGRANISVKVTTDTQTIGN